MRRGSLAVLLVCAALGVAQAQSQKEPQRVDRRKTVGKLSLTLGAIWESASAPNDAMGRPAIALLQSAPDAIVWTDLRLYLDAKEVAHSHQDVRVDLRLRLTPQSPFAGASRRVGDSRITARGAQGGREYELRELYDSWQFGESNLTFGRQIVLDADAMTIDGLRFTRRYGLHTQMEVFGGLYPDPYSRTIEDDYVSTGSLAAAGGVDVAYELLPRAHGAVAVAAATFFGNDTGTGLAGVPPMFSNQVIGEAKEATRAFFFWRNYFRPHDKIDLWNYVVFDFAGKPGLHVSNGQFGATFRPFGRLRLELGYSRMATFAQEMYIKRYLYREPDPAFLSLQNNLVLMRMAQDEARLLLALTFGNEGRFVIYGVGRYLHRGYLLQLDPRFQNDSADAGDVTIGITDLKSIFKTRLALDFIFREDYRSSVRIITFDLQRDFAKGAGMIEFQAGYQRWRDSRYGVRCDPTAAYRTCFGTSDGFLLDFGGLISYRLSNGWFVLADYHLLLQTALTPDSPGGTPYILTNVGFGRLQYRF